MHVCGTGIPPRTASIHGRLQGSLFLGDAVRQQFTRQERDNETGLDYFRARFYSSTQGRFSSTDPLMASGDVGDPQTFNRYTYVRNNPLNLVDPTGMMIGKVEHDNWDYDAEMFSKLQEFQHRQFPWVMKQDPKKVGKPPTVLGPNGEIPGDVLVIDGKPANKPPSDSETYPPYDPDVHVAKDNDDFRQINLSISPKALVGGGIHFAFTWDKFGRHYFSAGPSFGVGLPISANILTGQTIRDGVHVRDKANVESILTGPSGSLNVCPVICMNGSWNINKWNFFVGPPLPKGGGTFAMGAGTPEVSVGKDWSWKLWF